jgi:hypothetical protein
MIRDRRKKGHAKAKKREVASTYQSPEIAPLPSVRPPLELVFWPAAAEAKLEGRLDGILSKRYRKKNCQAI